ncbi:MAG: 4-hydroxy-tetrahydrodipicolinate synthase [Pseudomonadota bacterium]
MSEEALSRIQGSITALATPFRNGAVDEAAFRALVERQIEAGTHGLVPCGTTGESPTISHEEHRRLIALCVEVSAGRVPVIAGAGSNATAEAIALAQFSEEAGADAVLAVTGYYNKPSQAGLIAHYEALSNATRRPIVVYNVPGRTVADISVETMGALAKLPNVIGVKDATGDLARMARHRLACGEDFICLSGEDPTAVGFNAMGGRGCISVLSNVVPEECSAMQDATLRGDYQVALEWQDRLAALAEALFADTSPGPTKYALSRLGLCSDELRLPLAPPSAKAREKVDAAMAALGLV